MFTFSSRYLFKYDLINRVTIKLTKSIKNHKDPFSTEFIKGRRIPLLDHTEKPPKVKASEIFGSCNKINCQNIEIWF